MSQGFFAMNANMFAAFCAHCFFLADFAVSKIFVLTRWDFKPNGSKHLTFDKKKETTFRQSPSSILFNRNPG
ncbi:MAG: hypothetical protein EA394_00890 [Bacteroidia bacterium]|nr:MAG: hypothetical protein EA394_00890 [Bacteroidia bacterium]